MWGRVVREGDEEAEEDGDDDKEEDEYDGGDEHGIGEGAVAEAVEPLPRALEVLPLLYPAPVTDGVRHAADVDERKDNSYDRPGNSEYHQYDGVVARSYLGAFDYHFCLAQSDEAPKAVYHRRKRDDKPHLRQEKEGRLYVLPVPELT